MMLRDIFVIYILIERFQEECLFLSLRFRQTNESNSVHVRSVTETTPPDQKCSISAENRPSVLHSVSVPSLPDPLINFLRIKVNFYTAFRQTKYADSVNIACQSHSRKREER